MARYVNPKRVKLTGVSAPVKRVRISKKLNIKGVGSVSQQRFITVQGVDRIVKSLAILPPKLRKKVIVPVLRSEAKVVQKRAKALVPFDADGHQLPGGKHLRQTIKVRVAKTKRRNQISMKVVTGTGKELGIPANEKGYYPFALEYGGLAWQPKPYMKPAYLQTKGQVVKTARYKIAQGIEEIMRGFK